MLIQEVSFPGGGGVGGYSVIACHICTTLLTVKPEPSLIPPEGVGVISEGVYKQYLLYG